MLKTDAKIVRVNPNTCTEQDIKEFDHQTKELIKNG